VLRFSVLSLACSASTDATDEGTAGAEEDLSAAQEFGCTVDDDCVAVSKGGCCPNGWNVAVNKHHSRYYANHNTCATPDQVCPLYVILDTRVAQCSSAGKCEMVSPDGMACGGFVAHPHECPDGYTCEASTKNPDFPGTCKKTPPPPPPADCRTTGCATGSTCQICWANYACVPKGAVC
jgi:hypothetical protein